MRIPRGFMNDLPSILSLGIIMPLLCLAIMFRVPERYTLATPEWESDSLPQRIEEMLMVRSRTLFYNRVPKCGSFSLIILFTAYTRDNPKKFRLHRSFINNSNSFRYMSHEAQHNYVINPMQWISKPVLYEQHVRFICYKDHHIPTPPLYINVIRQPIDRMHSEWKFYGSAKRGQSDFKWPEDTSFVPLMHDIFGRNFEYFCGQDAFCGENSELAMERAKENVKRHYLLVGVTERLGDTVEVLEFLVPQFYQGIFDVFEGSDVRFHFNAIPKAGGFSPRIMQHLEDDLRLDIKFYNWIFNRFADLHNVVKDCKESGYGDIFEVILRRNSTLLRRLVPFLPLDDLTDLAQEVRIT